MAQDLKKLYQDLILHHNQNPQFFGKSPERSHQVDAYNPICGDQFALFFEMDNARIEQASFHGYGCAISKASSSLLMEYIQNRPLPEVNELIQLFLNYLDEPEKYAEQLPEPLRAFGVARNFAGRQQCASLSWESLRDYLNKV